MSLIHNERLKLTATYLNAAARACLVAGVIAPFAAFAFGYATAAFGSTLTFALGATTFLLASLSLHSAARFILKGLRP